MGKRLTWAFAFAIALVSCTDGGEESGATAAETAPTTSEAADPTTTDPGRLVLLDSSGDIVVMDPDGANRLEITDDAGESAVYTQPIWSPDASMLAWGQVTEDGFGVGIHEPGAEDVAVVETTNLPFYMYWSPDGQNLGVLHNGATGVEFQMIDVQEATSSSLDEDAPFYFSWSPEGDRVVTHAGLSRAELISPDGERVELEPTAPTYLAPQWTDSGVFHVVDDELVLETEGGERTPVAAVSGLTMFVSNPQGTSVALQATGDESDITASSEDFPTVVTQAVVVVDVATGDADIISNRLALGFFWSPDGRSLLVLTTSGDTVIPRVWTADGEQAGFDGYRPPGTMVQDTFPFFPQYAQSLSFWAPDSTAFAYAGVVDGEPGVWVQDLGSQSPEKVSDGIWIAWSPPSP